MQLRKAQRTKAKLRIGLSGPSGSGKTYSALLLASGFTSWDKICLIDTENGSGDLYEHLGPYNVIPLTAPYSPQRYREAIETAQNAGMEVIIIDSISHEWTGEGGCLDMAEQVTKRMKNPNSYMAWAKVTPEHNAFIQKILESSCHIITTVRAKTEYILTEKNGKQVPQKAGMGQITRDGFEYELTVSLDLDLDHKTFTSKDRTGLFTDVEPFAISKKTGELLSAWGNKGVEAPEVVEDTEDIDAAIEGEKEPKLNSVQNGRIHALIAQKGADRDKLKEYFKVESMADLTAAQAQKAIEMLEAKPDKKEEEDIPFV